MSKLERKIQENKEHFDIHEPSDDHFETFSRKLAKYNHPDRQVWNIRWILRIAAVIAIMALVSFLVSQFYMRNRPSVYAENQTALPKELMEVEAYYTKMNNDKLTRIEQLAGSDKEATRLRQMAMHEVKEINASTVELQNEYSKGAKSERILDAIANNYRIMTNLLDHIIIELNQTNKQNTNQNQNNENQAI
ncbi:MAG: hypothetical protein NT175_13645 [Bacteroidetes bacterium]|nr:hypothetical protein [Bacteroidota bacterium]